MIIIIPQTPKDARSLARLAEVEEMRALKRGDAAEARAREEEAWSYREEAQALENGVVPFTWGGG